MFVVAKVACTLDDAEPMILHGAGSWLLDDKAESWLKENPDGKGHCPTFENDLVKVVLEVSEQADTKLMTLREALQSLENSGFLDFELSGYTKDRPPEVQQGLAEDRFAG